MKQGDKDKPPGRHDIVRLAFQVAGETVTKAQPLQHSMWVAELRSRITGVLASKSDFFIGITL